MNCPECKKPMQWQEGLLNDGYRDMSVGRYYCLNCKLFMKHGESAAIMRGRQMAHNLVGVGCMDKQITRLPGTVQIGILRERGHCKTCGKPIYSSSGTDPCKCTKCDCLYCRSYK